MYFEGKCTADKLIQSLVKNISEATDETGNKLWEMISSNVGVRNNTVSDDGWVFKSKGTTGEENIIIGFANGQAYNTQSYHWLWGGLMFVASDYAPGIPGTNGTFKGYMEESLSVFGSEWNNYSADNLPMRYYLSVTKDRVICAYYSEVLHQHSRTNLIYLGKPLWTADPKDKGTLIAGGISSLFNTVSQIRMTNPFSSVVTHNYNQFAVRADLGDQARGWGGKLYPSRMLLARSSSGSGGYRAILDLLVVKQDGQFRKIDTVKIGDIEFLCVELSYQVISYNTSNYLLNNFTPGGYNSGSLMYLFPKI